MNPIQAFFSQLSERFATLSQGQKVAALVLATVTIGSILAMSFWIKYQSWFTLVFDDFCNHRLQNIFSQFGF